MLTAKPNTRTLPPHITHTFARQGLAQTQTEGGTDRLSPHIIHAHDAIVHTHRKIGEHYAQGF